MAEDIRAGLKFQLEKTRKRLGERMPAATPLTFSHGDLANINTMVKDGDVMGIIDRRLPPVRFDL